MYIIEKQSDYVYQCEQGIILNLNCTTHNKVLVIIGCYFRILLATQLWGVPQRWLHLLMPPPGLNHITSQPRRRAQLAARGPKNKSCRISGSMTSDPTTSHNQPGYHCNKARSTFDPASDEKSPLRRCTLDIYVLMNRAVDFQERRGGCWAVEGAIRTARHRFRYGPLAAANAQQPEPEGLARTEMMEELRIELCAPRWNGNPGDTS